MVGIVSSENYPFVMELTIELFPAFCNPTILISNYFEKKIDLTQSVNL